MKKAALIVAGGSGTRMGTSLPKQFLDLQGKPILIHTVERFLHLDPNLSIVLVLPEAFFELWHEKASLHLPASLEVNKRLTLCAGGASRTESVSKGLLMLQEMLPEHPQEYLVGIHDGVRPFIRKTELENAYQVAEQYGASLVCVPVKSSIREQLAEGGSRAVDRSRFFHVQTPQTFALDQILRAYSKRKHDKYTDDASLFEEFGGKITICEGSYENLKITTPEDLYIAENILKKQAKQAD